MSVESVKEGILWAMRTTLPPDSSRIAKRMFICSILDEPDLFKDTPPETNRNVSEKSQNLELFNTI